MTEIRLTPSARRNLRTIWSYTAKAWGVPQADSYVKALHNDIARLTDFPNLGAPHATRLADFRKLASGHHLIFYIVGDRGVEVVRVLHMRMDAQAHLP